MESKEIFSQRLVQLREDRGITQQTLADDLKITRQSLSLYEKAERTINIDLLVKIANYFNVSADYLLGLNENATTDTELKAVCDYTGLSEEAVIELKELSSFDPLKNSNPDVFECKKHIRSSFVENGSFKGLTELLYQLNKDTEEYMSFLDNKTNRNEETNYNTDFDICDFDRYVINKNMEFILNIYDNRIPLEQKPIPIVNLTKAISEVTEAVIKDIEEDPDNGNDNPKKE